MNRETAVAVGRVAKAERIDLAKLLAVVEVESSGDPFESADRKWPRFLFERHLFHRNLSGDKLEAAEQAGLAIPKWNRATQYKDLNTSAKRIAVLNRARAIDEEAALKSCSWGIGQVLGSNHLVCGFSSARQMVEALRTLEGQIRAMVAFIKGNRLDGVLARADWAAFARGYNGAAYKQNKYDTKLAAAYAKWRGSVADIEKAVANSTAPAPLAATRVAQEAADKAAEPTGTAPLATGAAGAVLMGGGAYAASPHWIVPAIVLGALAILGFAVVCFKIRRKNAQTDAIAAAAVAGGATLYNQGDAA